MGNNTSQSRFSRSQDIRSYKKVVHIFPEGKKTEPRYFNGLNKLCKNVRLEIHSCRKKTSAVQVLTLAQEFIANGIITLRKGDEAWLVVDVDNNKKEDLELLFRWSEESERYGFALSNPKFEIWLLQHFELGDAIQSVSECDARLMRHLENYTKAGFNVAKFLDKIPNAISNAEIKYKHCNDWFYDFHTTVFRLVKRILDLEKEVI